MGLMRQNRENGYLIEHSIFYSFILCPFRFLQTCQFVTGVSVDDCSEIFSFDPIKLR
jgi:hypothetical protein